MKKLLIVSSLLLCLGWISCADNKNSSGDAGYANMINMDVLKKDEAEASSTTEEDKPSSPASDDIPFQMEQKLIKNGDVSFRVKNLNETKQNLKKVVASLNGYISKETSYGHTESPSEEVIVRVPGKNFDMFMEEVLKGAEEVDSKNVDIEDVTEQFVDIEARLKNKKQLEAKYQELLVKANNMEDILKIEKEISYIREDIEASEGRLKYLGNRVAFSTITLKFYEKRISGFNFGGKMGRAIENGGTGFLWFVIGFMSLWPLWIFGLILWFVIARIIRKYKSKKA